MKMKGISADLVRKVVQVIDADTERQKTIVKDIHRHPELGFMETRTAGIVAGELKAMGSEDAHMLVNDLEEVKIAYLPIGTAEPGIFAQATAERKPILFSNHQPNYQVDLNAMP